MATRPSPGNTSAPKFVPCVTITSAQAERIRIRAQRATGNRLRGTVHLQLRKFAGTHFKTDLHRLTANLAIFDVRLAAIGQIQQNANRFRTKRTTDPAFHDGGVHV